MASDIDFSNGRRGPILPPPKGKTGITIYIDDDVLEAYCDQAEAEGRGYQIAMNDALRRAIFPATSQHAVLLARLQQAIAKVLESVNIVEPKPRAIAKRTPRAGGAAKTAKNAKTTKIAKKRKP